MKVEFVFFDVIQIFEDVYFYKKLKFVKILEICNYIFVVIFIMEFILKVIGFGFIKYFFFVWNCLDVFIVFVSILSCLVCLIGYFRVNMRDLVLKIQYENVLSFF